VHVDADGSTDAVGPVLVFQSRIADSSDERPVHRRAAGMVITVCGQAVKSGATAPTMIPKRNTVPVALDG
jgi:hypothetical protein